ncbi:MAG: GNAT family N-acetyltransferase [Planctomycetota bacterium]|nr:GNAT family N-acetyltransferase [Planctomycetota bacterium]
MTDSTQAPPFSLRPAALDDARAIAEVHVASWRAAYKGLVPDAHLDGLNVETRTVKFREWLEAAGVPERRTWVLEEAGRVIGHGETQPARDAGLDPARVAELCAIYLHPAAWGRGGGRLLLAEALDDLRARGFEACVLWVLENNARSRRFYEIAGFALDGGRKPLTFAGRTVDAVRYRMSLELA